MKSFLTCLREADTGKLIDVYFQEFPIFRDVLSNDEPYHSYVSGIYKALQNNLDKIKSVSAEPPERPLIAILRKRYNPEQTFPVWACEYAYESDIHADSAALCTWNIVNPEQFLSCGIADTEINSGNPYVVMAHILHAVFCVQRFSGSEQAVPNMTVELHTEDPLREEAVIDYLNEEIMDRVSEINRKYFSAAIQTRE